MNEEKVIELGSYALKIERENEGKYQHSAALYKNGKLYTKFRKNKPITEDEMFEFFLDKTLLKRTNQDVNLNEKI